MPHSRPMPGIGPRCHELRVPDGRLNWRIIYGLDTDAVVIVAVFAEKAARTPDEIIAACRTRLRGYDDA